MEDVKIKLKMDKKTFWIIAGIIIAVLLILVIWQTMQINSIASGGEIAKTASSATSAARSYSGMVGGC